MSTPLLEEVESIFLPDGPLAQRFAGYEYRPQQLEMAVGIARALTRADGARHCLVEAGTGVGKTVAYLIPAVLWAKTGKRVVISTHTINLQGQLVGKDIPLVQSVLEEHPFKAVLVKGRSNYLCRMELDNALGDILSQNDPDFEKLRKWVAETETGDVAELPFAFQHWGEVCSNQDTCRHNECHYCDTCFYYRVRREAACADIIAVNHSLFFSDLSIKLEDPKSGVLPKYDAVIFDEAHHLEDIAGKTFGVELTNVRANWLLNRVGRMRGVSIPTSGLEAIKSANDAIFQACALFPKQEFFLEELLNGTYAKHILGSAGEMSSLLDNLNRELAAQQEHADPDLKERIMGYRRVCGRIREDLDMLFFRDEENYFKWGDKPSGSRFIQCCLHTTPIDVSRMLKDRLWKGVDSAVLTSATLSNSGGFEYMKSRLGVEDAVELVLDSPFDFETQALLYVPVDLEFPSEREDYASEVASRIEEILRLSQGRAFVLFTSYRMLNAVHARLTDAGLPFRLLRQGEMSNDRLLREFRKDGRACLFGVHSFWEGVDVKGEALSCVIIDKLPFAVPDSPVHKARVEALKAAGEDWFRAYAMPQAQIRLKQGFGRLIRTQTDRGVVCILDSRLMKRQYGAEFLRHLPRSRRTVKLTDVEEFFE